MSDIPMPWQNVPLDEDDDEIRNVRQYPNINMPPEGTAQAAKNRWDEGVARDTVKAGFNQLDKMIGQPVEGKYGRNDFGVSITAPPEMSEPPVQNHVPDPRYQEALAGFQSSMPPFDPRMGGNPDMHTPENLAMLQSAGDADHSAMMGQMFPQSYPPEAPSMQDQGDMARAAAPQRPVLQAADQAGQQLMNKEELMKPQEEEELLDYNPGRYARR